MKKVRSIILLAAMFLLLFSLINIVKAADATYGSVTTITSGGSVEQNTTAEVTVSYDQTELTWSPADPAIGRTVDGYWIGFKIEAPSIVNNEETAKKAQFRKKFTGSDWSPTKSLYQVKDGEWFFNSWVNIDMDDLEAHKSETEYLLYTAEFDWDGNGDYEQKLNLKINPSKTVLKDTDEIIKVTLKTAGKGNPNYTKTLPIQQGKSFDDYEEGTIERSIIDNLMGKAGFVKFYKMNEDAKDDEFDISKVDTYTEYTTDTAFEQDEQEVTIVAYFDLEEETTPEEQQKDDTPKTGSLNLVTFIGAIALVSLAGVVVLNKKN